MSTENSQVKDQLSSPDHPKGSEEQQAWGQWVVNNYTMLDTWGSFQKYFCKTLKIELKFSS